MYIQDTWGAHTCRYYVYLLTGGMQEVHGSLHTTLLQTLDSPHFGPVREQNVFCIYMYVRAHTCICTCHHSRYVYRCSLQYDADDLTRTCPWLGWVDPCSSCPPLADSLSCHAEPHMPLESSPASSSLHPNSPAGALQTHSMVDSERREKEGEETER